MSIKIGTNTVITDDLAITLPITAAASTVAALNVTDTLNVTNMTTISGLQITSGLPRITLTDNQVTSGTFELDVNSLDFNIRHKPDGQASRRRITVADDGDITFYDTSGYTANVFYDASLARLGIGNTSPTTTLDVTGTITADTFSGPLTGNVTGNVTGDVAGDIDLSPIAATISDTAVDIFVYDTRKDSDGGAWRKRTQHTSWYNETLNTSTRGSRKEFPAVAVIVADNTTNPDQITIYDADDPDMPMWMVIEGSGGRPLYSGGITAVAALNGQLWAGTAGTGALSEFHFLKDYAELRIDSTYAYNYRTMVNRNVSTNDTVTGTTQAIINRSINDVAMTVLPNAPIDAATGLPVPTIAVATDGGVSVIKDDGTVVDITGGAGILSKVTSIDFTSENDLLFNSVSYYTTCVQPIPSTDKSLSVLYSGVYRYTSYDVVGGVNLVGDSAAGQPTINIALPNDNFAAASPSGLNIVSRNALQESGGMVAYTTSDYNTGWMNGDIKLATLSDTDDTNVTGSEIIANYDFSTTGNWTLGTGWSITGGQLVDSSASSSSTTSDQFSLTADKTYTLSFEVTGSGGRPTIFLRKNGSTTGLQFQVPVDPSDGYYSYTFSVDTSGSDYDIQVSAGAFTGSFDFISVRLAEEDRSVNGNGLQVFGTVTKSAVATGADLVAYSGWSANTNYLEQPYNSDLDFGTGDFCFTGWAKPQTSGTYRWMLAYGDGDRSSGNRGIGIRNITSATAMEVRIGADTLSFTVPSSGWFHLVVLRRNGIQEVYVNGVLNASGTSVWSTTITGATFRLGDGYNHSFSSVGSLLGWTNPLALWRISATAPSPEQIKKIYEDEKVLFQDGAQATLYGSSDAVTALAYDDSTNLLHVGTSAGRSVFQGLRRVDNTTTAVGAAISASNGLVADE